VTFQLSRLRVSGRMFAGFGVLLVPLMLVAGFSIVELQSTGSSLARINTVSDALQRALELGRELEVMHQRSLRYKTVHDKTAIEEGTHTSLLGPFYREATPTLQAAGRWIR